MPYINKWNRSELDPTMSDIIDAYDEGSLNFQITCLIDNYLNTHGFCYANINAVVGALECAKLELYRRIAAPYEDMKIKENGDVYRNIDDTDSDE